MLPDIDKWSKNCLKGFYWTLSRNVSRIYKIEVKTLPDIENAKIFEKILEKLIKHNYEHTPWQT